MLVKLIFSSHLNAIFLLDDFYIQPQKGTQAGFSHLYQVHRDEIDQHQSVEDLSGGGSIQ